MAARKPFDPADYVGHVGVYTMPIRNQAVKFRIGVEIVDAKRQYGRVDLKITPIEGEGEAWVSSRTVKVCHNPRKD